MSREVRMEAKVPPSSPFPWYNTRYLLLYLPTISTLPIFNPRTFTLYNHSPFSMPFYYVK